MLFNMALTYIRYGVYGAKFGAKVGLLVGLALVLPGYFSSDYKNYPDDTKKTMKNILKMTTYGGFMIGGINITIPGSWIAYQYYLHRIEQMSRLYDLNNKLADSIRAKNVNHMIQYLQQGAEVNAVYHDGTTPLILASQVGNLIGASYLLKRKAKVNIRAKDGSTALIRATVKNHAYIVRLLLQHESDRLIKNKAGKTAEEIATEKNYHEIINIFLEDSKATVCMGLETAGGASNIYRFFGNGKNDQGETVKNDAIADKNTIGIVLSYL